MINHNLSWYQLQSTTKIITKLISNTSNIEPKRLSHIIPYLQGYNIPAKCLVVKGPRPDDPSSRSSFASFSIENSNLSSSVNQSENLVSGGQIVKTDPALLFSMQIALNILK